ncbi:MAG: hypothetical protein JXA03_06685 [Bacteroidales bacterium]|nr:hypothetical protein [Bacteroidales bacterium]
MLTRKNCPQPVATMILALFLLPFSLLRSEDGKTNRMTEDYIPTTGQNLPVILDISKPTVKILFGEDKYSPGDLVTVNIELKNSESGPLYFHEYKWELFENGVSLTKLINVTDENGKATIRFRIPNVLLSKTLLLKITTSHDGTTETISDWVPVTF